MTTTQEIESLAARLDALADTWHPACAEGAQMLRALAKERDALKADAERWRKFAEDGAPDAMAEIIRYQDVKRIQPDSPTPCRGFDDQNYRIATVVYERQAIREIRILWVGEDGSKTTLLHMIDAALQASKEQS